MRYLAVLLALALAALGWQTIRLRDAQLALATHIAADATATADAIAKARAADQSSLAIIFDAGNAYDKGASDAKANSDRVLSGLNRGTIRLRDEWQGCEAGRLSDSAAARRAAVEADQRRAALAASIVQVGAECDAFQRSMIAAWNGIRKTVNGAQ